MKLYYLWLLIISFGLFFSAKTNFAYEPIRLYIETSEGGDTSPFRIEKFKKYLHLKQCVIEEISSGNKPADSSKVDFIFSPLQPSVPKQFVKLANIKVINDEKLSGSILVRGSTGIKNIVNLAGVRIAFLSPESSTGYQLQQSLFEAAAIVHSAEKTTFAQTNSAAISLLLHKEVFAAAIATPLAKKWAKTNDLIIVATSKDVNVGGFWVRKDLSSDIIENCANAMVQITKDGEENQRLLRLFPAWIDSFSL